MRPELFAEPVRAIRGFSLWRPWPQSMHGWVAQECHRCPDGPCCCIGGPRHVLHRGPKDIENRTWHPPKDLVGRCWIALQSGLTFDHSVPQWLRDRGWTFEGPFPSGVVTGIGFLERSFGTCTEEGGCARCTTPDEEIRLRVKRALSAGSKDEMQNFKHYYMGDVGWVLTGLVPFITPVTLTGGQGLRRIKPETVKLLALEYDRAINAIGSQLPPGPRWSES